MLNRPDIVTILKQMRGETVPNLSGRWEVYVQRFPDADTRWQISPDGRRFLMMREEELLDHGGGAAQLVLIQTRVSEVERRVRADSGCKNWSHPDEMAFIAPIASDQPGDFVGAIASFRRRWN